ncbi:hypothetical protein AWW66_11550 [Micromonospora rosaria]|uniref:PASTA domain-containing protein n=1 Tax=Micromonospora rosaria TaxID=47874 RepID=A0A136PTS6_9ACTN|nr:PASTA domain-containing protein [Micromonospora rosaria]KXK61813.1 hypothetical protein AWW66_11550 [Micromonospora rosaria]
MSDDRQEPPTGEDDDRTRQLPPGPGTPAAWSGRAGVPPPRPPGYPEPEAEWYGDEPTGRRWWTPILLGLVALALLGLVGAGLWLASQPTGDTGPESPTAAPTLAPTTGTRTPATPGRTPATTPPTTTPATTAPTTGSATVPVPPLVGLAQGTAETILDRLGVRYRLTYRSAPDRPGTVIETDPAAGTPVPAGQEVTLVISEGPASAPTTAPTSGPPATVTP